MTGMSQRAIARAREQFFLDGTVHPGLRPEILVSWRRSARLGIHPESETVPSFVASQRSASLRRAAEPVVQRLLRDVGEDYAAMLLLNSAGIVIGRWSASTRINRTLDESSVEPGRLFDEGAAGTTGLGTPLENGRSATVEGAEHVLSALDTLTAVGTPILHPARGSIEGVIDIVGLVGVDTTMMVPLVARAARDIGDRLIAGYAAEDRKLMDAFLTAERRGPKRPMLAINDRLVIGNPLGNQLGLASEHLELWERTRTAISQQESTISVYLAMGLEMSGRIVPVGDTELVGAIVHLDNSPRNAGAVANGPNLVRAMNETVFDDLERTAIRQALEQAGGNKRNAAAVLGVSRATLYRKMMRLGIRA